MREKLTLEQYTRRVFEFELDRARELYRVNPEKGRSGYRRWLHSVHKFHLLAGNPIEREAIEQEARRDGAKIVSSLY